MTSLRVLVVGKDSPVAEQLQEIGHQVTPVDACGIAVEALQLQKFDAVVLSADFPSREQAALALEIQQLNRFSSSRTAMVGISAEDGPDRLLPELDGYLPGQGTPEALSAALVSLATGSRLAEVLDSDSPELPVIDGQELQKQLDFDTDLLLELIALYASERKRQSPEMDQALASGDFSQLSRLAHTIKGSLGSLQAPAARAKAQLLELAAMEKNKPLCEQLLPALELQLDRLDVELQGLSRSLAAGR